MFGVLVIGAPGAGKSTLCAGLCDAFAQLRREPFMVNLDPGNDATPYVCDADVRELVAVEEVMHRLHLGPNGAIKYSMATLAANKAWLIDKLVANKHKYAVIDCPGQLELYKSDAELVEIIREAEKVGVRLCALHLSDSLYCSEPTTFISVVLSTLSIMTQLEMPQVNVLSKIDLLGDDLAFDLEFFTQMQDISKLLDLLNDVPELHKYRELNKAICDVVADYDLVSFVPLNVMRKEDMAKVIAFVDKANGFALSDHGDLRDLLLEPIVDAKPVL